ncbi:unknown [Firmicutes bacterium CAG:94]|nr:unknown [Firmicutes bacterium CAG:94]
MTPTFSRSWLMKMATQLDLEMAPASLRRAWLISRACKPTWESPISPSISARGTKAATESTTITSMALERTKASVISKACSPVSGWLTSRLSTSTPRLPA